MEQSQLPFSHVEYQKRLAAVRNEMDTREADVLLVDEVEHLVYLTGYAPTAATYQVCVIPSNDEPFMLVRALDEPTFLEQSWLRNYITFADWEDSVAVLCRMLIERNLSQKRIAQELDSHFLLPMRYEAIKAALPNATFLDFSGVMWQLRLRKSPQEIEYMRRAAKIADQALLGGINAVQEGENERLVAIGVYSTALALGADNGRIALMTSGTRSNALHGSLGNRLLAAGDILHIEAVPAFHGYSARIMRPTVIGSPSNEQQEVAQTLIEIQERQFASMKPGAVAYDVDRVCRDSVLEAGLREEYPNTTGYTLGYVGIPRTSDFTRVFLPTSDWTLEQGMVFHMYTWAKGMAFSETVLVTDEGHERLTKLDRQLFVR